MASSSPGWDKNGKVYTKQLQTVRNPKIGRNLRTSLVVDISTGKQQIVETGTGTVIYERNLDDKKWKTKDRELGNIGLSNKLGLQNTANTSSYNLIQREGNDTEKSNANESEAFKSQKNGGTDNTSELQKAYNPLPLNQNPFVGLAGKRGGRIQYPLNMTNEQDKVRFTAVEILPVETGSTVGKVQYSQPKRGSIYIAAQAPIIDTNTVKWGEDTLNPIQNYALGKAREVIGEGDIGGAASEAMKDTAGMIEKYGSEIGDYFAGQAVGNPNVLARTQRKILNPNLELLFQGPQLRAFQMSFKMSARSSQEAENIKAIIRYFKQNMAVRKDGGNTFLKAPYVFTIRYLHGDEEHPSIGRISPKISGETKACALLSCSTDYTPLGSYATYNDADATMVAYTINLQFQEIEPLYDTDYDSAQNPWGDHDIGF